MTDFLHEDCGHFLISSEENSLDVYREKKILPKKGVKKTEKYFMPVAFFLNFYDFRRNGRERRKCVTLLRVDFAMWLIPSLLCGGTRHRFELTDVLEQPVGPNLWIELSK